MKATEAKLLSFLQKSPQFVIPIYQRTYSWTDKQCRQLWDDILRAGSSDTIAVHFIGSIVYVEQGLSQVTHQAPLLVIDGQQRLTTVSLLIEALARALGDGEPVDGFSAAKLRHYYLSNPLESGDRYFKLLLSQTDNASLKAIIKNTEQPKEPSLRVTQNFALFTELLDARKGDLASVCRGLAKLVVVDIALSRDQDNPQLIFESMNSTGKELSQADLIRNFILMGLEPTLQTRLYEDHWRPMELDFGQEAYGTQFDSFMRHYLTVRTGDIPREREVYEAFKDYSRTTPVQGAGIEALVKEIRAFARYFCALALGREQDATLGMAFHDLRELKVDVAYPFLLELYHDYATDTLSAADFASAVRLVEAYVFRRAICAIPTNSMNKTFATFGKALKKDRYLESIQAHFLTLPSYRRFPPTTSSGATCTRATSTTSAAAATGCAGWRTTAARSACRWTSTPSSTSCRRTPTFRRRGSRRSAGVAARAAAVAAHPRQPHAHRLQRRVQRPPLRREARHEGRLQAEPAQAQRRARPARRVERSRHPGARGAAGRSGARGVGRAEARCRNARRAISRRKGARGGGYTIEDHPHLLGPALREVFEAFRKEVLALDPCVTEEFLKLYVAYKAETNFVDVVPQAKRLHLHHEHGPLPRSTTRRAVQAT